MLTACTFHHTNKYPAFALEPVHCTETTLRPPPPPPQSSSQKYHYLRCHNHLELTELLTPFWRSPFFFYRFTFYFVNHKPKGVSRTEPSTSFHHVPNLIWVVSNLKSNLCNILVPSSLIKTTNETRGTELNVH